MSQWKDDTSYSRDKPRIPQTWSLDVGKVMRVTVTCGHIYYPGQWIAHAHPLFKELPLNIPGDATPEQAQRAALKVVRERIDEMYSTIHAAE